MNELYSDFALWIMLIIIVVKVTELQHNNNNIKNTITIILTIIVIKRTLINNITIPQLFKTFVLYLCIIAYLHKDKYNSHTLLYYLIKINITIMALPSIYYGDYNLAIQILISSYLFPKNYFELSNDNPQKIWFNIVHCSTFTNYYLFDNSFRHWSLMPLISIIPMALNIMNKSIDAISYRLIGIALILILSYDNEYSIFNTDHDIENNIFKYKKPKQLFSKFANLIYKYNDKNKNKLLYNTMISINYIIIFINLYIQKNNTHLLDLFRK